MEIYIGYNASEKTHCKIKQIISESSAGIDLLYLEADFNENKLRDRNK